jgi:hypothetical protein
MPESACKANHKGSKLRPYLSDAKQRDLTVTERKRPLRPPLAQIEDAGSRLGFGESET